MINIIREKLNNWICPICEGKIIRRCKCPRLDSICENGHQLHYSHYHEEYHLGLSDHSTGTFDENCCNDKIKVEI